MKKRRMFAVYRQTGQLVERSDDYRGAEKIARQHAVRSKECVVICHRSSRLADVAPGPNGRVHIDLTEKGSVYA
ncbi:hypothetical protein AA101099_1804 [Neoasaia chiangmaiensis NBRC 101099]|nr:hypothetical protein [Neoasaia chiangmaiensis]GBR39758.1 hypothetical protein AA101099_1804 [Neoasaia chiangmaiensis NBRC 101099]